MTNDSNTNIGCGVDVNLQIAGDNGGCSANTAFDDSKVSELDILLFDQNRNYLGRDEVYISNVSNTKDIKFKLNGASTYDLVFFANCHKEVIAALGDISKGESLDNAIKKIIFVKNSSEDWSALNDAPMWAEKDNFSPKREKNLEVNMLRMYSQIQISLSKESLKLFQPESIQLFNCNNTGQIAPNDSVYDAVNNVVTGVSVPPVTIPVSYSYIMTKEHPTSTIYCFETINRIDTPQDGIFLLLKGKYGTLENQYYRINLSHINTTEGKATYLDVLRNHKYVINVSHITGNGVSEDEAKNHLRDTPHLSCDIIDWTSTNMGDVIFNGENFLKIDNTSFDLLKQAYINSENQFTILTDCLQGWSIDKSEIKDDAGNPANDWLDVDQVSGKQDQQSRVTLSVQENTSGKDRVGYIPVVAYNMNYRLKVSQSADNAYEISFEIKNDKGEFDPLPINSNLNFDEKNAKDITFRVKWTVPDQACTIKNSIDEAGKGLVFKTGNNYTDLNAQTQTATGGTQEYTVSAADMAAPISVMDQRVTHTQFSLTTLSGKEVSRSIQFSQVHYGIVFPNGSEVVCPIGGAVSVLVQSNAPWTVSVDPNFGKGPEIVQSFSPKSAQANKYGQFFTVSLWSFVNVGDQVRFIFSSPNGLFQDVPVTITAVNKPSIEYPNSYIVYPGNPIDIPVTKAYNMWRKYNDEIKSNVKAVLQWQDEPSLVSSCELADGDPSHPENAHIHVETNSEHMGNALVSLIAKGADGEDKVCWSWHIWVTDYNPGDDTGYRTHYAIVCMDRNLGATNNIFSNNGKMTHRSLGLLYQWGNNLPIPGSDSDVPADESKQMTLYDLNNNIVRQHWEQGSYLSAREAVQEPMNFRVPKDMEHFWNGGDPNDFWKVSKGDYDPCPEGWVTIPSTNIFKKGNFPTKVVSDLYPLFWIDEQYKSDAWPLAGTFNKIESDGSLSLSKVYKEGVYGTSSLLGSKARFNTMILDAGSVPPTWMPDLPISDLTSVRCVSNSWY